MKQFEYVITEETGLHARPAGNLAKICKELGVKVTLEADKKRADASKIMAVMALGIKKGTGISVSVEGENEEEAAQKLENFFQKNL